MEDQQLNPLAITHILQHTLRSFCITDNSPWLYAVFWRILPRNFPPPNYWDLQGGAYDRGRGNKRNWILVWEDGFCNFAPSAIPQAGGACSSAASYGEGGGEGGTSKGLQPEIFFKMTHEIYNYGEGLIGKVAADQSYKWVYKELTTSSKEPQESHPRTWAAQFQSGIKTIALIAVREGVVQLGAVNKVIEDLSFVVHLRNMFAYLDSIPGVFFPHPSSSTLPTRIEDQHPDGWPPPIPQGPLTAAVAPPYELFDQFGQHMRVEPSMTSLEALLSKLPSVGAASPGMPPPSLGRYDMPVFMTGTSQRSAMDGDERKRVAKEEVDHEYGAGESSCSLPYSYYDSVKKSAGEEF